MTELHDRATRVQADIDAGKKLSDEILLQHRMDCRFLCEECHAVGDRYSAIQWIKRAYWAQDALSPEWRRRREAELEASPSW